MSLFGLDYARLVVICLGFKVLTVHIWLFCNTSSLLTILS